jgi:peptide/nickel transport system substrate-binding protein
LGKRFKQNYQEEVTIMKKRQYLLVIVVFVVFAISILSSLNSWAKGKDEVIISQRRDVATLDWITNTWMETNTVSRCIFNALIDLQSDYTYAGSLATSWKVFDDLTWHFYLRKGVKYHNGEAFDADDVKFTIERMQDKELKSPWAWLVKEIAEVNIVDPYTIELKTTSPQPGLLAKLVYIPIIPKDTVKTYVNPDFGLNPVGTGPYEFVEWIKDERVVLKANENYWGGKPKINRVVFRPLPEGSSRVAALLSGGIDVCIAVPPSHWADVKKNSNTKLDYKSGTMVYLGLDTLHPPMDNIKVRQAMNHAVDVQGITDSILEGSAARMNGPFHEGTLGYDPSIQPYSYDPAKAKKLLAEAGYPNGVEIRMSFHPGGAEGATNHAEVAEAMAYQLAEVGIKVKLEPMESAVHWANYKDQKLQTYIYTWPERWEPERYLRALFHSKARGYYYRSETADKLLDGGNSTFDRKERKKVYQQLHRFLYEDAPWVYLYKQMVGFGFHKGLNFQAPFDGYVKPWEWSWK